MIATEDIWDYNVEFNIIEQKQYCEYETKICSFKEVLLQRLEDRFKVQTFAYNANVPQDHVDKLKELVEKNRLLPNQIEKKLGELAHQQLQYENYKKDQKLITQEIKETHEAFLMAKKYYKKYLKMYHTIESSDGETQTIFLQFFTEAKRDSENYSVRLLRNSKTRRYQLISTTPKLSNTKELKRKLQDTNDVPGALCAIRQAFMTLKSNKKLQEFHN